MTTAQIQVNRAERGDHAKVGAALGAAFVDDPVFQWLIPVDSANRDNFSRLYCDFTGCRGTFADEVKGFIETTGSRKPANHGSAWVRRNILAVHHHLQ